MFKHKIIKLPTRSLKQSCINLAPVFQGLRNKRDDNIRILAGDIA